MGETFSFYLSIVKKRRNHALTPALSNLMGEEELSAVIFESEGSILIGHFVPVATVGTAGLGDSIGSGALITSAIEALCCL